MLDAEFDLDDGSKLNGSNPDTSDWDKVFVDKPPSTNDDDFVAKTKNPTEDEENLLKEKIADNKHKRWVESIKIVFTRNVVSISITVLSIMCVVEVYSVWPNVSESKVFYDTFDILKAIIPIGIGYLIGNSREGK